jgi:hypothetical protein
MASIVCAVGMFIARLSALMAIAQNLIPYPFSKPVIKNKILAFKFIGEIFFLMSLR